MEQGTGKTLTIIQHLRRIYANKGAVQRTLVLCPAVVIDNWQHEIERFSKCGPYVVKLVGPGKKRIETIEKAPVGSIFITNYEALDIDGLFCKKGKGNQRSPIDRGISILVCDEIHRCKNPTAKRTKLLIKLRDFMDECFILSGTPVLNSPMDIWAQYRIMDKGKTFGTSFYAFRNEYFINRNANKPSHVSWPDWTLKPDSSEKMNTLIGRTSFRVKKEECLDLPPLIQKTVTIELSKEQKKLYDTLKKDYFAEIDTRKVISADLAITKLIRLQQITTGFCQPDGEDDPIFFKTNPRRDTLKELLTDLSGKIIIWAVFKANYKDIETVCQSLDKSYTLLTGEQSTQKKMKAVEDFTKGDTQILIANPGAGGTGVNLTEAPYSIYYSRNFNLEHRLQSEARNYRGGSTIHKKVTHYDIVAKDTIDQQVTEALHRKENISKTLIDKKKGIL
jgi:SNF2 family DNA or RNA helicase